MVAPNEIDTLYSTLSFYQMLVVKAVICDRWPAVLEHQSDIAEQYGDPRFLMQLHTFAEAVYLTVLAPLLITLLANALLLTDDALSVSLPSGRYQLLCFTISLHQLHTNKAFLLTSSATPFRLINMLILRSIGGIRLNYK
ncbi:hypothetical protein LY76DRAFT_405888 [Colletotrichum caudatum]|nr:hypothetical protein LY76DRAFT_405888 [Colletotrichum caudatum]